ncbi:Bromodomain-containing protein [Hesseltinella vesiculosa]|uniref:Bromodomain-containing protein n=1 Tax=Hesseltinella vesiculosa TaxID=101127 RepID=A0A1X2GRA0_9FUNG|nr:Bromodomain-containing protein [Hesseltinella vesiculosa]
MSHQAQKRPFASLMEQDHDSGMNDPSSPPAHDTEPHTMTTQEHRYCSKVLKALMRQNRATAFLNPVDVVALNIPDYPAIIKQPMDLGTINTNLDNHLYSSINSFFSDVQLIFSNCYMYNGYNDPVSLDAQSLEEVFEAWKRKRPYTLDPATSTPADALDNLMSNQQFQRCESVLKEMKRQKHSGYTWPFLAPVDADAWGATDYYQIIQTPMDMKTVENKLQDYEYASDADFEQDMKLIFANCYKYNTPDHTVYQLGKKSEKLFDSLWSKGTKVKKGSKKDAKSKSKKLKLVHQSTYDFAPPVSLDDMDYIPTLPDHDQLPVPVTEPPALMESPAPTQPTAPKNSFTLRLKLTAKPPSEPTNPEPVARDLPPEPPLSLGLSTDPFRPKLAIGNKVHANSTMISKQPNKTPVVLQNESMWQAIADKAKTHDQLPEAMSSSQPLPGASSAATTPTATAPRPIKRSASTTQPLPPKPKPALPPPTKGLDLNELVGRIHNKDRAWEQQRQKEEETRARQGRRTMEVRQQELRELEDQRREQREWMDQQRRRDSAARLAALNVNTIDISAQKRIMEAFEANEMSQDQDFRDLQRYYRHTVDYRRIPSITSISQRHTADDLRNIARRIAEDGRRLRGEL